MPPGQQPQQMWDHQRPSGSSNRSEGPGGGETILRPLGPKCFVWMLHLARFKIKYEICICIFFPFWSTGEFFIVRLAPRKRNRGPQPRVRKGTDTDPTTMHPLLCLLWLRFFSGGCWFPVVAKTGCTKDGFIIVSSTGIGQSASIEKETDEMNSLKVSKVKNCENMSQRTKGPKRPKGQRAQGPREQNFWFKLTDFASNPVKLHQTQFSILLASCICSNIIKWKMGFTNSCWKWIGVWCIAGFVCARVAGWIHYITYLLCLHKMKAKMKWALQNETKMKNERWTMTIESEIKHGNERWNWQIQIQWLLVWPGEFRILHICSIYTKWMSKWNGLCKMKRTMKNERWTMTIESKMKYDNERWNWKIQIQWLLVWSGEFRILHFHCIYKKNECENEMHFAKWNERWKMKMNHDNWK